MSARPYRILRADAAGDYLTPAPTKMSFYDLQARFWQLEAERPFSGNETKCYFYWLNRFNAERWPGQLRRFLKQVAADVSLDEKSVAKAAAGLQNRGLLAYSAGTRRQAATWTLPADDRNYSGRQAQEAPRTSHDERNNYVQDGKFGPRTSHDERKFSAPYKEEEEDSREEEEKTTTPFGRSAAARDESEVVELAGEEGAEVGRAAPPPESPAPPPKKKVAPKKKPPERPVRLARPEVPFADSELADFAAFETALAGTDYELADLRYYHEKIKNWRQKGEPPLRKDWLATSKQFFLNDARENCLKLAPGVHHAAAGHGPPVGSGAPATGYRSERYDR